jgi:hypothetical protein
VCFQGQQSAAPPAATQGCCQLLQASAVLQRKVAEKAASATAPLNSTQQQRSRTEAASAQVTGRNSHACMLLAQPASCACHTMPSQGVTPDGYNSLQEHPTAGHTVQNSSWLAWPLQPHLHAAAAARARASVSYCPSVATCVVLQVEVRPKRKSITVPTAQVGTCGCCWLPVTCVVPGA